MGHLLGQQKCPQAMPHCRGEALMGFWEFIIKLCRQDYPQEKSRFFLEIYEKILQNHTEARKWLPSFLAASRLPWEGVCRRPGQSSKAAQGGPMGKGQNKCDIAFGLGAWGEELGFSPKATMFLPLGYLLGRQECPQAMPHCCGRLW